MPSYVPNTDADRQAMLATLGLATIDDLFADIQVTCSTQTWTFPQVSQSWNCSKNWRSSPKRT